MRKFPNLPAELSALVNPALHGAACKGMAPLFDPQEKDEPAADAEARYHQARNVCRTCPVRANCAEALMDLPKGERRGIWSGRLFTETNQRKSAAA